MKTLKKLRISFNKCNLNFPGHLTKFLGQKLSRLISELIIAYFTANDLY